jgi:hypothetical protein
MPLKLCLHLIRTHHGNMNALVVLRHAYDRISHEPVLLPMELGITDWTFPDEVSFRRNILPSPSSFGKH